jgi:hypothetical protein
MSACISARLCNALHKKMKDIDFPCSVLPSAVDAGSHTHTHTHTHIS